MIGSWKGRRVYLWWAISKHGDALGVLVQERREANAAERFFRSLLEHAGGAPERITTDKLRSYASALQRLPEIKEAEHLQVRSR